MWFFLTNKIIFDNFVKYEIDSDNTQDYHVLYAATDVTAERYTTGSVDLVIGDKDQCMLAMNAIDFAIKSGQGWVDLSSMIAP